MNADQVTPPSAPALTLRQTDLEAHLRRVDPGNPRLRHLLHDMVESDL